MELNTETSFKNSRHLFKPVKGYYPLHPFVKNWAFTYGNIKEEVTAFKEANLAHCMATVAEENGLSNNDIRAIFPLVLRMLKSTSEWAK